MQTKVLYIDMGVIRDMKNLYDGRYDKIMCSALRKDNVIYSGVTHADCFRQAPKGELRCAEQGFLTNSGDFVDRKLGLKIAEYYNQVVQKHPPLDELLSEDLMKI